MWYVPLTMPAPWLARPPAAPLAISLALAAAVSLALRLPFLSVPLITDEGGYAYVAYWLARGQALYRDLWFDRPQGIFLIYGAILRLFGESTEAIRLAAGLYNAGTTVLLGLLGARLFGPLAGAGAAGVFAVASASPVIEGFTANGEVFMNLPVVLCVLLAVQRRPFLAGVVLALATAIKPTALPAAGPALLVALWNPPGGAPTRAPLPSRPAGSTPPRLPSLARAALGAVLGFAPFLLHGLATDPSGYLYAVVGFRVQAHSAFSVGLPFAGELGQTAPTVLAALLPVWLLAFFALRGGSWKTPGGAAGGAGPQAGGPGGAVGGAGPQAGGPGGRVALAFLLGALAGAAAGGYWYWHYYAGLVSPAALLAGAGLARLLAPAPSAAPVTRADAVFPLALGASLAVALFFNARLVGASPEETSWRIYRRPAYLASREIAGYVADRTAAQDTIYAAFAQADLYYHSRRRSAGSYLYWTEINRVPGALEALLETLDDPLRRPRYVIRIDQELETPGQAGPFWSRVEHLYHPETAIEGFQLYRSRDDVAAAGGAG
jgi:hypothetical protein